MLKHRPPPMGMSYIWAVSATVPPKPTRPTTHMPSLEDKNPVRGGVNMHGTFLGDPVKETDVF
jgi:hypothetical protein